MKKTHYVGALCAVLAMMLAVAPLAMAQDPSARTAQDGNWSDPDTWQEGHAPSENTTQVRMQHDVVLDVDFSFSGDGSWDGLLGPGYNRASSFYLDAELHVDSPGGGRAVIIGFEGPDQQEGFMHIRDGGLLDANNRVWVGMHGGSPAGTGIGHLIVEPGGRLNLHGSGYLMISFVFSEDDILPPPGCTFRVIGGGGDIKPNQLRVGPGGIFVVEPSANGAEGLTLVEANHLILTDTGNDLMQDTDTTLRIAPSYPVSVGDSWDLVQFGQLHNRFEHIETVPEGLEVAVDYDNNTLTVTVTDAPEPPAAPSDLTATADGADAIDLAWTDNADDEEGFAIERRDDDAPGADFEEIATVGADVTTYRDTDVQPGGAYTYRVRAFNDIGESDFSNEAAATTEIVMHVALDTNTSEMMHAILDEPIQMGVEVFFAQDDPSFQWYKEDPDGGAPIPVGVDASVLVFDAVQESDAGVYWCEVTAGDDTENSPTITLVVSDALPVTGAMGLSLLALLMSGAAWLTLRRRAC